MPDESKTIEDLKTILREFAREIEAEDSEEKIEAKLYSLAVAVIVDSALKRRQQRLSA